MSRAGPLLQDDVVVGNRYDKHGSRNPVARRLQGGFERGFFELLDLVQPFASLLEVGCGEGHMTSKIAARFPGVRVLGTDFSTTILGVARAAHPGIAFEACSIYDAGRLGEWDVVVSPEVLEHLEDPARALRAVASIARVALLVTVPREPVWRMLNVARGRYWGRLGNTDGHLQHWSRGSLLRFLAGEVDVIATRTPLPWTQALCRPRRSRTA